MVNVILMIIISVIFVFAFVKTISSWRDGDCCGCGGGKCPVCDKGIQENTATMSEEIVEEQK